MPPLKSYTTGIAFTKLSFCYFYVHIHIYLIRFCFIRSGYSDFCRKKPFCKWLVYSTNIHCDHAAIKICVIWNQVQHQQSTWWVSLKLYWRYEYTTPCMINCIWGLKQLWLQVNGHAWFHLQRLCWPVRNGEGAKTSKWKYVSPAGFEPTPRLFATGKSAP